MAAFRPHRYPVPLGTHSLGYRPSQIAVQRIESCNFIFPLFADGAAPLQIAQTFFTHICRKKNPPSLCRLCLSLQKILDTHHQKYQIGRIISNSRSIHPPLLLSYRKGFCIREYHIHMSHKHGDSFRLLTSHFIHHISSLINLYPFCPLGRKPRFHCPGSLLFLMRRRRYGRPFFQQCLHLRKM